MQLLVLLPPLEQTPDQMTSRPFGLLSVIRVPTGKLATPVVPTETLSPTGEETMATPPPPQVWGAVQVPQVSVPPQPSAMLPQVVPWAAQLVGMQRVAPPSTIRTDSKMPVVLLSAIAAMTFPSPETAMASVTTQLAAPGAPAST